MYKKLAGIFTLMVMLTIFILPMQAKACDHPSCLRAKEVMAEAAEVSIDDIVDFCAYRPRIVPEIPALDVVTHGIIEDLLQYLMLEYGTAVELVSIDIMEAVQQYDYIQPRLGCCLNQNIEINYSTFRMFAIYPSNRNWEFCDRYEVWRTVWCTSCRFACTDSRRMVNVIPGCRMLRVRFAGFANESIINEESYKEECDNCL